MNDTELKTLSLKVCKLLPDYWVEDTSREPQKDRATIRRSDGLQITFAANYYSAKGKLEISFQRPRDEKGEWVDLYDKAGCKLSWMSSSYLCTGRQYFSSGWVHKRKQKGTLRRIIISHYAKGIKIFSKVILGAPFSRFYFRNKSKTCDVLYL